MFGEDVAVVEPEPLTSERAHLRTPGERLRDELYAQTIRATSPHRYVEVERLGGSDDVELRLASGAVRLSARDLEREIQGCLATGVQEYRRVHSAIRRQVFGPGLELSPFGEEVSIKPGAEQWAKDRFRLRSVPCSSRSLAGNHCLKILTATMLRTCSLQRWERMVR